MDKKCENCQYWFESNRECRVSHPEYHEVVGMKSCVWPVTDRIDWCGKFQAKKNEN